MEEGWHCGGTLRSPFSSCWIVDFPFLKKVPHMPLPLVVFLGDPFVLALGLAFGSALALVFGLLQFAPMCPVWSHLKHFIFDTSVGQSRAKCPAFPHLLHFEVPFPTASTYWSSGYSPSAPSSSCTWNTPCPLLEKYWSNVSESTPTAISAWWQISFHIMQTNALPANLWRHFSFSIDRHIINLFCFLSMFLQVTGAFIWHQPQQCNIPQHNHRFALFDPPQNGWFSDLMIPE